MRNDHEFSSGGLTQEASKTAPILALIGERQEANLARVIDLAARAEKIADYLIGLTTERAAPVPEEGKVNGRLNDLLRTHEQISMNLNRVDRALARLGDAIG